MCLWITSPNTIVGQIQNLLDKHKCNMKDHKHKCNLILDPYLLARPPPGGRLGMLSGRRLCMTWLRSGMPSSPDFSMISAERDNYITHVGQQTANGSLECFLHCDCCCETSEWCRHRINHPTYRDGVRKIISSQTKNAKHVSSQLS